MHTASKPGSTGSILSRSMRRAERQILAGAKRTLERFRPRMAVNMHYNSGRDYADIPRVLRENLSGPYRYYVRHYARTHRYTLIYAAPVAISSA